MNKKYYFHLQIDSFSHLFSSPLQRLHQVSPSVEFNISLLEYIILFIFIFFLNWYRLKRVFKKHFIYVFILDLYLLLFCAFCLSDSLPHFIIFILYLPADEDRACEENSDHCDVPILLWTYCFKEIFLAGQIFALPLFGYKMPPWISFRRYFLFPV